MWYFNNYQDDSVFDDDDQDLSSIASADTSMSSLARFDTSLTSKSGTLPRRWKPPVSESVEGLSVTDGSFSSYFSLPRRLFRSEVNLHKADSQATLRSERSKVQLQSDWQEEDKLEPGLFGLLEDPGVLRLEFSDYPDSVFETEEAQDILDLRHHQDITHNSKDWIRKSYDELDVDSNRTEIIYNRVSSGKQGKA